jgi:hypothetical protein
MEVKQKFMGGVGTVWNVETLNLVGAEGPERLTNLREELSKLRQEAEKRAQTPEQHEAVKQIAEAEASAKTGTASKVVAHLKAAGSWVARIAADLGSSVIAKLIEGQLHLG